MRSFQWLLNWSLSDIHTCHGDIIPVVNKGKFIGNCTISIEGDRVIGKFNLKEDLDDSQYVLYMISLPDGTSQRWLEGIMLVEHYEGIENRARAAKDMFAIQ